MKATIDGVDFEASPQELAEFLQMYANAKGMHNTGTRANGDSFSINHMPPDTNSDSLYYSIERTRYSDKMCATYDFVAKHKRGRTYHQVAEAMKIKPATANSRLNRLVDDELLMRTSYGYYVATKESQ